MGTVPGFSRAEGAAAARTRMRKLLRTARDLREQGLVEEAARTEEAVRQLFKEYQKAYPICAFSPYRVGNGR